MVNLPKGATVANNRDTMAMFGGGETVKPMIVQLYLDGSKLAENTVNYINNGRVRLNLA